MNFQDWLYEKKVEQHHLVFMNALKTQQQKDSFHSLATELASFNPSQSSGLKFLEILADLILLNKEGQVLRNFNSFDLWKEHLRALRYPQTASHDLQFKEKLEKLSWPSNSKIKFERRGDRAGVELKTFITSALDIKKFAAELERLEKDFPE